MQTNQIEESQTWHTLEGLENLTYSILEIDRSTGYAAVLFKLEANQPIILHRHCALNKALVLSGEHVIYEPDGSVAEIRLTGCYKIIPASDEPHSESGGDNGAIVLFHIWDNGGTLYELLDDQRNIVGVLTMDDLEALYEQQAA